MSECACGGVVPSNRDNRVVCAACWKPWPDERTEQEDVLARFLGELTKATGDGAVKRRKGTKPPWYSDDSHEAAVFSHLMKWKKGELADQDSGAHPLVHAAWRCLAIACRESGNVPFYEETLS